MSLIMGVVQKDFVMISSDSALTVWDYDKKKFDNYNEFEVTGKVERLDVSSEKVVKLTDKVLITYSGSGLLTEVILWEIMYYMKPHYDLNRCKEIAVKVLDDVNNGIYHNKKKLFKVLKEHFQFNEAELFLLKINFRKIIDELLLNAKKVDNLVTGYVCYLLGFNDDGTTGIVDIKNNSCSGGPKSINKGYPAFVEGPEGDQYLQLLNIPVQQRTLHGFLNRFALIHAEISEKHKANVSKDCNYHTLVIVDNKLEYLNFTLDTSKLNNS